MPYTIITLPEPETITVQGINGPEQRQRPVPTERPAECETLIYTEGRTELWSVRTGGMTDATIFAALPGIRTWQKRVQQATAKEVIERKWPLWAQNNCALGIYGDAAAKQCRADIAAVINACNTAEDAIDAATTISGMLSTTTIWPEV
jgi:hypothetical protein